MAKHSDDATTSSIEARRDAAAELGQALRETIMALVASEVSDADLLDAASRARQITELLGRSVRPLNQVAAIDDLVTGIRSFSPVVGRANPMAPPLQFSPQGDGVISFTMLDRRFEGPPGYVHGGITALLFDEALGRAAASADRWGMTASLSVQYSGAVPLDAELVITARVSASDGRKTALEGWIALASDPEKHLASASGLFIQPRHDTHAKYFGSLVDGDGTPMTEAIGIYE